MSVRVRRSLMVPTARFRAGDIFEPKHLVKGEGERGSQQSDRPARRVMVRARRV